MSTFTYIIDSEHQIRHHAHTWRYVSDEYMIFMHRWFLDRVRWIKWWEIHKKGKTRSTHFRSYELTHKDIGCRVLLTYTEKPVNIGLWSKWYYLGGKEIVENPEKYYRS